MPRHLPPTEDTTQADTSHTFTSKNLLLSSTSSTTKEAMNSSIMWPDTSEVGWHWNIQYWWYTVPTCNQVTKSTTCLNNTYQSVFVVNMWNFQFVLTNYQKLLVKTKKIWVGKMGINGWFSMEWPYSNIYSRLLLQNNPQRLVAVILKVILHRFLLIKRTSNFCVQVLTAVKSLNAVSPKTNILHKLI